MVLAQIHAKDIEDKPQFIRVRDWSLVTSENIMREIKENERLNGIFNYQDPDIVAEILVEELNNILEKIAPSKVVQMRKENNPRDKETLRKKKECDQQLEIAIEKNENEEWRLHKSLRNQLTKWLERINRMKMEETCGNPKKMWRKVKNYVTPEKGTIPLKIITQEKTETSPGKLAKIMNDFFIKNVEDIQKSFKETDNNPVEYLEKLIPRPDDKFHLEEITIKETYEIITNMKVSNSTGFDNLNSRFLKEITIKETYTIISNMKVSNS